MKRESTRLKSFRQTVLIIVAYLVAYLAMTPGLWQPAWAGKNVLVRYFVKGQVKDQANQPVAGALIELHDRDRDRSWQGRSDRQGRFEIEHEHSGSLSVAVFPPAKTGLAQFYMADITGSETKTLIANLHRGFTIGGKVVAPDGRGVKGIVISVEPQGQAITQQDSIHGGGTTITGRGGTFAMVVTPGEKELTLHNHRYSDLAAVERTKISVTRDEDTGPILLPARTGIGARQ